VKTTNFLEGRFILNSLLGAGGSCYPEDRDKEDCGLKPAQANSSQDLISKNPITTKKGLVEWLKR
jgi:hypothetical protein